MSEGSDGVSNQEKIVSHRLMRIFADLFAVRTPLQQQQSAKAGVDHPTL
jgi:hypothetical protein